MSKPTTQKKEVRFAVLNCKVLLSLSEQSKEVQDRVRAQIKSEKKQLEIV